MHHDEITVEVLDANDTPFIEYKDAVEFADTDDMSQCIIELPAAGQCQDFGLRYSASPDSKHFDNGGALNCFYFLEDQPDLGLKNGTGAIVEKSYPVRTFHASDGLVAGYDTQTQTNLVRKTSFYPLRIVENADGAEGTKAPSGFVEIRVWKVKVGERTTKSAIYAPVSSKAASEKLMKGKDISCTVETGPTKPGKGKRFSVTYLSTQPIHRFRFHYRTRESLISRGLINFPVDDHAVAVAVKQELEIDSVKVKKEAEDLRQRNRELERELARLKRKRTETGEGRPGSSIIDDDEELQEVPPPTRKRIEISLLDD